MKAFPHAIKADCLPQRVGGFAKKATGLEGKDPSPKEPKNTGCTHQFSGAALVMARLNTFALTGWFNLQ
jgi:hypothetical protein